MGKCDTRFTPGKFAQQVVLVWRKNAFKHRAEAAWQLPQMMASAQRSLSQKGGMVKAANRMSNSGKPLLSLELLERAAIFHGFGKLPQAVTPDAQFLALALGRLAEQSILPTHFVPNEQTARLLVCDGSSMGRD